MCDFIARASLSLASPLFLKLASKLFAFHAVQKILVQTSAKPIINLLHKKIKKV